jgi:hypothetical protein
MATRAIEAEDLIPSIRLDLFVTNEEVQRRKMDMAISMVDQYCDLGRQWSWGDGILEWIRQCEITFKGHVGLSPLLRPDVWPHAGNSSFVRLLQDKAISPSGVDLQRAVGFRLAYRHMPPLSDLSEQFLYYLGPRIASAAYNTWAGMMPDPISSLPPERFHVQVVSM